MEIVRGLDGFLEKVSISSSSVTIGVFDGVHIGHRKIIEHLIKAKIKDRLEKSILLTFSNHPLTVTHPEMAPRLLTTLDEKLSLLDETGVDLVVVIDFTDGFSRKTYMEFVDEILLSGLRMRHLVLGYDFHLGRNREGSQQRLIEYGIKRGFQVTVVPPVVSWGSAVSSTRIRRCVLERKFSRVRRLLGRSFFFDAVVIRGAGVGRQLNFPTANLSVEDPMKLIPPDGVYAVNVEIDGKLFAGMMNIGLAPTIHQDSKRRVEVHIFDLSEEIYGKKVRIYVEAFIREEELFTDSSELVSRLRNDKEVVLELLKKND